MILCAEHLRDRDRSSRFRFFEISRLSKIAIAQKTFGRAIVADQLENRELIRGQNFRRRLAAEIFKTADYVAGFIKTAGKSLAPYTYFKEEIRGAPPGAPNGHQLCGGDEVIKHISRGRPTTRESDNLVGNYRKIRSSGAGWMGIRYPPAYPHAPEGK